MSKLEDFIRDNREQLDSYEPGNKSWEEIERKLPLINSRSVVRKYFNWKRWAAAAAVLILMIPAAYYFLAANQKFVDAPGQARTILPPEYAGEVNHFTRLIELKHKELQKLEKDEPELYRQFAGDINKLDSNYQALKKALPDNPNQEMLLEAMIGNLKWQLDLLNQQLVIIQKINHSKKITNEKVYKST